MYVKVNLVGKKGCSILKLELPAKGTDLKYYRHKEVGKRISWKGKKAWIMDLKEASPDGKTLRVTFDIENDRKRRTGNYNPVSNIITAE